VRTIDSPLDSVVELKRGAWPACRFYMTDKRIVLSTAGSQEEARKIARTLVDRRLAACVNIVPGAESVYRWQGRVETSGEWLLVMKTTTAAFPALRDALRELHSYEVPECLMLAVEDGAAAYLEWIGESVQ
jgi:periplasmic divalent cation tolerance protein